MIALIVILVGIIVLATLVGTIVSFIDGIGLLALGATLAITLICAGVDIVMGAILFLLLSNGLIFTAWCLVVILVVLLVCMLI